MQKKVLNVLSTAAMTSVLATALTSTAFAKTTDILVKDTASNKLYQYSYEDLKNSLLDDKVLFNEFKTKKAMAYKDDKAGYVDFAYVAELYMADKASFNVNTSLQNAPAANVLAPTDAITTRVVANGTVADGTVLNGTPVSTDFAVKSAMSEDVFGNETAVANGIAPNGTINLYLNAAADESTVIGDNIKVVKKDGNITQPIKVTYDETDKYITVDLVADGAYDNNATYVLTVNNIKTADGKQTLSYSKEFTTGSQFVVTKVDKSTSGTVQLTFNKAIDASTVTASTFRLFNITDGEYVSDADGVIAINATTRTATLTNANPFATNKKFKVMVSDSVKALDGTSIGGNFEYKFNTLTAWTPVGKTALIGTDAVAFEAADPSDVNGRLIPNKAGTKVPFSYKLFTVDALDATTVNTDNVYIETKVDKVKVDSVVSYDANQKVITIAPKADLKDKTDYEVVIGKDLKDANGKYVNGQDHNEISGRFTTGDFTAPTVKSASLDNGSTVKFGTKLSFTFSERMSASAFALQNANDDLWKVGATAGAATISIYDMTAKQYVSTGVVLSTDVVDTATKLSLTLPASANADFVRSHTYKITFKGFVQGAAANMNDIYASGQDNSLEKNYEFTFTTEGADDVKPTVVGLTADNDSNDGYEKSVAVPSVMADDSKDLYVTFSEKLNPTAGLIGSSTVGTVTANTQTGTNDADGVVVLEKYNDYLGRWLKVGLTTDSTHGVVQTNAANTASYVAIKASDIAANEGAKLRVRVIPKVSAGTVSAVADEAGNFLADEWTSAEFIADPGNAVAYTTASDANKANTTVSANAEGDQAVLAVTTTTGLKVNDVVTVKLATGDYFTSKITAVSGLNITLADKLPAYVSSGTRVIEGNNALRFDSAFNGSDAVVVKISGVNTATTTTGITLGAQSITLTGSTYASLNNPVAGDKVLLKDSTAQDGFKMYTVNSVDKSGSNYILNLSTSDVMTAKNYDTIAKVVSSVDVNTVNANTVSLKQGDTLVTTKLHTTVVNNDVYVTIVPLGTDGKAVSLAGSTPYTLSATAGIKDTLGNSVTARTWNFTTAASYSNFDVASKTIANGSVGVKVDTPIDITFNSEPTNTSVGLITVYTGSTNVTSLFDIYKDDDNKKIVHVVPRGFLATGTTYTVTLPLSMTNGGGSAKDLSQTYSSNVTINFQTETDASNKPKIISATAYDVDGTAGITQNDIVRIKFNQNVWKDVNDNGIFDGGDVLLIAGLDQAADLTFVSGTVTTTTAITFVDESTIQFTLGSASDHITPGVTTVKAVDGVGGNAVWTDAFGNNFSTSAVTITKGN